MRSLIDSVIKQPDEDSFRESSEPIMNCLDQKNKNWTPFKIKKVVVDHIKQKLTEEPKMCGACQKLMSLKLLNRAIMKKNQEFNRYVEANLLESLAKLAQYGINQKSGRIQNSAQELLSRGKGIFGPSETDQTSSAKFLVILLDCIEKWSYLADSGENDQNGMTFENVYKQLCKQIQFPSSFRNKSAEQPQGTPANKKVSFCLVDTESANKDTVTIMKISDERKRQIHSSKRKMTRVKDAAKKYKKQLKNKNFDPQLAKEFTEMRKLALKCVYFLKPSQFGPHISNSKQLIEKMKKYAERFHEANRVDPKKA